MTRYVAFLRGVSPVNAKMAQLRACFERAGFSDVRTLLSSGNVVFSTRTASGAALERRAEQAMESQLGRSFSTIVRSCDFLKTLIAADHFAGFGLSPQAPRLLLPLERDGARILKQLDREVFSAYLPSPKGPVFMALLQRAFGTDITTRTLATVRKC